MAEFLVTTGISHRLEKLIKNAKERLILISPFLKINKRIQELLEDKNMFKIDTRLIYGKSELQPEETEWLNSKEYIRTSFCEHLHAKCYLNEKEAIITSMNLYEFSQVNNNEMGIIVDRDSDTDLYNSIYEEVNRLIRSSDEVKISVKKVKKYDIGNGVCIRCKKSIKLNPLYPLCNGCYAKWKKYSDTNYEEKFCHICGKDLKSTINKPTCYNCYKKNVSKLKFPKSEKKNVKA